MCCFFTRKQKNSGNFTCLCEESLFGASSSYNLIPNEDWIYNLRDSGSPSGTYSKCGREGIELCSFVENCKTLYKHGSYHSMKIFIWKQPKIAKGNSWPQFPPLLF